MTTTKETKVTTHTSARQESKANLEKLSEDVASLKSDVASLISTLKDVGRTEGQIARNTVEANAEMLQEKLAAASETAHDAVAELPEQTRTLVKQNPMTAVMLAAAAGALFGLVTARK